MSDHVGDKLAWPRREGSVAMLVNDETALRNFWGRLLNALDTPDAGAWHIARCCPARVRAGGRRAQRARYAREPGNKSGDATW